MASFRCDGLGDLLGDFGAIAELPDSVAEDMLNAEADVLMAAQSQTAGAMLAGPYDAGHVRAGISKTKVKLARDGKVMHITFRGTVKDNYYHHKPTRVAEIAFINEYGKSGQPARPFIRTANEAAGESAVKAAADVYDRYLRTRGF